MSAKHLLKEAGIDSFTLDQMDSAHAGLFGDIQLFVHEDRSDEARELLEKEQII